VPGRLALFSGDAGRRYLPARDADLKAGRFDRGWLVGQCR